MFERKAPQCVGCGCDVAPVRFKGNEMWHPIRCQPCSDRAERDARAKSSELADVAAKWRRWGKSRLSQRHISFLKEGAEAHIRDEIPKLIRSLMAGVSIYLHGETGTWKTTRAVQLGRFLVKMAPRGADLMYWTEADFFLEMRSRYSDRASGDPAHLLSELQRIPLLIFDDLGMTAQRTNSTTDWLLAMISHRYEARLPTVWTSNILPEELEDVIGAQAARRVREGTHIVHCRTPRGFEP
ncbi:MAG: ATP-binding protein [Bradymonadia bacterium]